MAEDVFSKMAEDPWLLKEDGYLNADTDLKKIIYHPSINVILICTCDGIVRVLDVNSGVVLQSSYLSAQNQSEITCRYIPGQDRILFCDGQAIGVRSDYNGVLLLDTILQKPVSSAKENVKIELLLSEAIILKQSLTSASNIVGIDHVINELTDKILEAQKLSKKGIKAQKWNTVCLDLPLELLSSSAVNTVSELLLKNQHTPELGVTSAVQERLSELLGEQSNTTDRRAMASEAKRRDTFTNWPHMDYKWALPDQMAQAGFYHQPNASGDDRAMCFTCTVCLVCWERTDEPWSEHERHSPTCPFVMGEYTQNVPLSVTYATNPAIDATYRGVSVKILGTSSVSNLLATANSEGLISVFDVSGRIKRTHSFFVTQFDSHILERFTQDFGVPGTYSDSDDVKYPAEKRITALSVVGEKTSNKTITVQNNHINVRPTIICGLNIRCQGPKKTQQSVIVETLNDQNKNNLSPINIMDVDQVTTTAVGNKENSCLYLVVYDFQYTKEQIEFDSENTSEASDISNNRNESTTVEDLKQWFVPNYSTINENENSVITSNMDIASSASDEITFLPTSNQSHKSFEALGLIKQQVLYQNLIPGASDELFLPPMSTPKQHSGPRSLPFDVINNETDTVAQATSLLIAQLPTMPMETNEKSISDHITELKNSKTSKKLNYSRAVQCITLPEQFRNRKDLDITDILPTSDGHHILVVLTSSYETKSNALIVYSLNFTSSKMVKLNETPVLVRELTGFEKPIEITLLPQIERVTTETVSKTNIEGTAILVCVDGAVRVVELSTLRTVSLAKLDCEKFISAAYCNSLERLCASTENGSLHFYALNDADNESSEDHEEEDLFGLSNDCSNMSTQPVDSLDGSDAAYCFHEPTDHIGIAELKRLHALCSFEPLKAGYCAVVPPCWSEMQQAQRQRRHPQSIQLDNDQHTKTWRLQTDTTTWDEHIFEITLPSPMCLGHVDVHFTLHASSASPHVEITLLRQNTSGIGHKRDMKFAVDEVITFDALQYADNPVTSQEYLRAHNADILAGPVDIASCLDLTEQGGCVTLTSPKLFKSRNRTLLLHIKAVYSKDEPVTKNTSNVKGKLRFETQSPGTAADKLSQSASRKTEFYLGCDCLHELSVTVYSPKHTDIPHEKTHRNSMLESNVFVQSLLLTSVNNSTNEIQCLVLDILNWIACIRLTRNRSQNSEAPCQQLDFLKVIESNLGKLLHNCLLLARRGVSHKCVKFIMTCSNGAKNINEPMSNHFDNCIFNNLLELLDSVNKVQSAAGLQWFILLLFRVAKPDQSAFFTTKCTTLLRRISDELYQRTNPYHLLLRSRFGLYGTPLEPELFDIEPPPPVKPTSTSVTYASVVAGDNATSNIDVHANFSFNKENLDPKDVLSTTSLEAKIKLKNIAPSKIVRGLLETEPLHFTCIAASDGTRVERADISNSSLINNVIPFTVNSSTPGGNSNGTKKEDIEQFLNDFADVISNNKNDNNGNSSQGPSNASSNITFSDGVYHMIFHTDNVKNDVDFTKLISDTLEIKIESDKKNKSNTQSKSVWRAEEIMSPNKHLPWQQLLIAPPQQMIVVERMHSGARRYVTLDFGQPVLLTDVLIPICHDLVSISIDIWLKSEDIDVTRLVVASDIGNRNLILNDLQPPPLCRFMKITTVGRYGMSTTRCRIPAGYFYGHLVILPEEVPTEQVHNYNVITSSDLEKQLNILSKLFEDVSCRYSLACSKLKDLLHPLLMSDITNASHLSAYISVIKDKSTSFTSTENSKIFAAYQEAITYQRQLNTVRNVMSRIESSLSTSKQQEKFIRNDLSDTCTDKLRAVAEGLLEILLSIDKMAEIDLETCRKLFQGLCMLQGSRVQLLAATLLDRSCGRKPFWGNFLADTLAEMFSSSYTIKFPQDRVFILLAYLGRKCPDRSAVMDATLRVTSQTLKPLGLNRPSLLAISIDLPLLGWLLMFLSLQLDLNKASMQSATRWDWVIGEMATSGKVNSDNSSTGYRKKLQKKFLQYKQQLENLDWTQKVVQSSAQVQALQSLSNHAANLTSKLEAALKSQENFLKKVKQNKPKDNKHNDSECSGSNKLIFASKRRREFSEPTSEKQSPLLAPVHLNPSHSLTVIKGLLSFILALDHSCSADMFLLACKVIARLVNMSKINLGQFMSEEQLLKLVNLCINSELPWAPHALACLLQDVLEAARPQTVETDVETETPTASTNWGNTSKVSDLLEDVESLCESFGLEDNFLSEPLTKQGKTTVNNNNNHLPSVYESDDSSLEDFLDDILERGRTLLKKSSTKGAHSNCNTSCAMDSRLELGVESGAEIALRKLITLNIHNLIQNINAVSVSSVETESEMPPWPSHLIVPWQILPQTSATNRSMLVGCFDSLFKDIHMKPTIYMENVLQLWLTLNCLNVEEKFEPSTVPFIGLSSEAVNSLVTAIAWSPNLSLRTWSMMLQTLTLVCNLTHVPNDPNSPWSDHYGLHGLTSCLINHRDFVHFLLRLLSGTGLIFFDKELAGPSLCKALHDFLVRLQMRCDVVSPNSKPGSLLKSILLKVVYQLVQPNGPLASRQGPLDAQCKLLQSMVYLDYGNADLSIAMSILESTGVLVHMYVSNDERIKCVNIGERLSPTSHSFSGIFASVLGSETNKQDRPVSWDMLLVSLLKLLGKLVQTPLPITSDQFEAMETESQVTSQTDESKAEQIQQDSVRNSPPVPCLADTVLQHHPSVIRLCQSLALCKASSLSMLANISQQSTFADLGEPGTVGDAVFHVLASLARKASRKELIIEPLLIFLSQAPQLSEPLLWFILQVLDTEDSLRTYLNAGGVSVLGQSLVTSSKAPNTISHSGTISMVMQHFGGSSNRSDANTAIAFASATKKLQQASLENTLALVNFAPFGSIRCQSTTAQPADVLIQGGAATHRRARTPQWSYHFYPEEAHTELTLQLPSAILLREVHLQPHLSALATCPSAVALELSANGPAHLVPTCPPLPTSGMTFIRLHLPIPEVVNCVQLRLYKPRDANNIGLSQIRLLGTSAFGGNIKQQILDLSEDESHCKHSLGWLRLLHHCFTLSTDGQLTKQVIANAAQVPDLLSTCCGLLLVPTHIPALYLPNLEKVLCELSLYDRESGLNAIRVLLECRSSISEPLSAIVTFGKEPLLLNSIGAQSACELLYQICGHQDADTPYRIAVILEWLQSVAQQAVVTGNTDNCSPVYVSSIASILWTANRSNVSYSLPSMITLEFFYIIYNLKTVIENNVALKYALDSLLCSLCYIKPELFPLLLQKIGVLVPNLSTDLGASISDDRKDSECMTDDTKQSFECDSEWYGHLVIGNLAELNLSNEQLETIALVSRSPTAIQQLIDSGLPKLLNSAILEFCTSSANNAFPMAKLENVTAILKFFADISDEKTMRDWLGSTDGSSFWLHLLHWLCKKNFMRKSSLQSEAHAQLEEVCVRFLSKCCLCHPSNQTRLAKVLCEVIALQCNGITGFMRRLILQLLLENEKIPVSVKADETLYKNSTALYTFLPIHPAFKQTHDRAFLYLNTNTTIADILEQHISFSASLKNETTSTNKKDLGNKAELIKGWWSMTVDSDLSVAAGVTAKDKRAKDVKNQMAATPQLKKKRYASSETASGLDAIEGRTIACDALPDFPLSLNLSLGQLLRLIESNGMTADWPCVHLTIYQNKGIEDKNNHIEINPSLYQRPFSSALQVFSSLGGLALLAQHLPTVYPETIRAPTSDKLPTEQLESDWVKVDGSDDIYEDIEETPGSSTPSKSSGIVSNVPPHSLTAFGLFLRLPGYAEVLLKDMKKALCLLRLVLGVTDDGEGGDIFQTPVADSLPTLPFEVLRKLYDATPLSTDDGRLLRRISINIGVVHLLLACLGIFTHQTQQANNDKDQKDNKTKDERGQLYWAKGTGFGTGSTQQSWNVEQALMKQRSEEEHVTVLLQVLASYINPGGKAADELSDSVLPPSFYHLLANSSLLPALSSYLRNDSVLDMARHIPLYRSTLQLLRALAASSQLITLLLPQKSNRNGPSVSSLLKNMKTCVDTYASKLRSAESHKTVKKFNNKPTNAKYKIKSGEQLEEMERDEGLALLMPDIQSTAMIVCSVTDRLIDSEQESRMEMNIEQPLITSVEEKYLKIMKNLQFDTFEMISELADGGYKFVVSHHFESNARSAGEQSHPARVKRLAQEAVTLATSLPLSYSSSVFVRCDTDRLDIMKVLITGPADTPYANGCFELDVFFPPDYPLSPMMINLETTGHHSVRFNPNLYNDGKVCLSVLNTWHGRPEEKWNAQTSSFLQVLVSIQSLILVPEPYFNEPGYERSRGTPSGTQSSKEYNANICQATVRWAMLEQIVNPCPCFKDVIQAHFYLKKQEIIAQVEGWIKELENEVTEKKTSRCSNKRSPLTNIDSFKKIFQQLKEKLLKLPPPQGMENELSSPQQPFENASASNSKQAIINGYPNEQDDIDTDIDMEKMVNDMCE